MMSISDEAHSFFYFQSTGGHLDLVTEVNQPWPFQKVRNSKVLKSMIFREVSASVFESILINAMGI